MINGHRELIRRFIKCLGFLTPANAAYLFDGQYSVKLYHKYKKELYDMCIVRDRDKQIRLIHNNDGRAGFVSAKNRLPTNNYNHDVLLRNCLAVLIYKGIMEPEQITLDTFADADVEGKLFIEFDNGNESRKELKDKLEKYYLGEGKFQGLFIMATQYKRSALKNEQGRVELLLEIAREVMPKMPNRILAVAYSEFLKKPLAYNFKGDKKTFIFG